MSILSGWIKTRRRKKTANGYKAVSYDTSAETVFYNNGLTLEESEVSLSQKAYDALGNEKLTNNVTYYITDANANDDVINEINKNVAANTTAISKLNNALGMRKENVFGENASSVQIVNYTHDKMYTIRISIDELEYYWSFIGSRSHEVHHRELLGNGFLGYFWLKVTASGVVEFVNAFLNGSYFTPSYRFCVFEDVK